MRIIGKHTRHQSAERIDLLFRDQLRSASAPDDFDHTSDLLNRQLFLLRKTYKTIAGEQWNFDFLLPILPLAKSFNGREQRLNPLLIQLISDKLFMPRPSPKRIPVRGGFSFVWFLPINLLKDVVEHLTIVNIRDPVIWRIKVPMPRVQPIKECKRLYVDR